jgi:6-hydroxytryprostatin B O-methyltransferase
MALKMAAAHEKWGADTTHTYQTTYDVALDIDLPFFDHIARGKVRMDEFAAYMRQVRSNDGLNLKHLVAGFEWQNIGEGGVVVEVSIVSSMFPVTPILTKAYARLIDQSAVLS